MSDEDADLLGNMAEALRRMTLYTADLDEDGFFQSQLTIDAVALNVLVVGECGKRLSNRTKVDLPAPWPDIISLRHRIAHGYASVNPQILWGVAKNFGPVLAAQIAALERR